MKLFMVADVVLNSQVKMVESVRCIVNIVINASSECELTVAFQEKDFLVHILQKRKMPGFSVL